MIPSKEFVLAMHISEWFISSLSKVQCYLGGLVVVSKDSVVVKSLFAHSKKMDQYDFHLFTY